MDIFSYFTHDRNGKKATYGESDMTTSKLALIYKVQASSIYLLDDRNKSIFPDGSGQFSVDKLTDGGHYEVVGELNNLETNEPTTSATPNAVVRPSSSGSSASAETQSSFTFNRSKRRLTTSTTFNKKIEIVVPYGSSFMERESIHISIQSSQCSVAAQAAKIQEEIDSEEGYVILNTQGSEIKESSSTKDPNWWTVNSRRILAMLESDFFEYDNERHNKKRNKDKCGTLDKITHSINRLVSASSALDKVSSAIDAAANNKVLVPLSTRVIDDITRQFSCIICKAIMRQPVYSGCCKMVQACKVCADEWFRNSPQCMKCRAADGKENLQEIRGLSMEWIKDLLD